MGDATRVIDTFVIDSLRGGHAAGIPVRLEAQRPDGAWELVSSGVMRPGGGSGDLSGRDAPSGLLRLVYDTSGYWIGLDRPALFPTLTISFESGADDGDHHQVLLLGPYGYTTYRGNPPVPAKA